MNSWVSGIDGAQLVERLQLELVDRLARAGVNGQRELVAERGAGAVHPREVDAAVADPGVGEVADPDRGGVGPAVLQRDVLAAGDRQLRADAQAALVAERRPVRLEHRVAGRVVDADVRGLRQAHAAEVRAEVEQGADLSTGEVSVDLRVRGEVQVDLLTDLAAGAGVTRNVGVLDGARAEREARQVEAVEATRRRGGGLGRCVAALAMVAAERPITDETATPAASTEHALAMRFRIGDSFLF